MTGGAGADNFVILAEGALNYDVVSDFSAGTTDDVIQIDISAINGGALSDTAGTALAAEAGAGEGAITIVNYTGAALASNTADVGLIKATALTYNSFTDLSTAIDAGNITLDASGTAFGVGEGILLTYYDLDGGYASVGYMESDAADVFDDGNTYVELARLTMSTTTYSSLDADNFLII